METSGSGYARCPVGRSPTGRQVLSIDYETFAKQLQAYPPGAVQVFDDKLDVQRYYRGKPFTMIWDEIVPYDRPDDKLFKQAIQCAGIGNTRAFDRMGFSARDRFIKHAARLAKGIAPSAAKWKLLSEKYIALKTADKLEKS